jgi:hypothetical protein
LAADKIDQYLKIGDDRSKEAAFYKQWSSASGTRNVMNKLSITDIDPLVKGDPEMYKFMNYKFLKDDSIKRQYRNINFYGVSSLEKRLVKLFKEEDMQLSLFNATNMKLLFENGRLVERDIQTGYYEVSPLKPLAKDMNNQFSEEELFAIYSYLVNLIDYTFLQKDNENIGFDKVSMSIVLSRVLKNEFRDFRAVFTSKLLAAVAFRYLKLDVCKESSNRLFPYTPIDVACGHEGLLLNTKEGLEFWFRLYIGRNYEDEQKLKTLTGHSLADLDVYFLDDNSNFIKFTHSIFDAIGMGKLNTVCKNNDNVW